ncbi:MAG: site-specific DNA-methyltransferase [Cyanobacteria bacterium MAG CAR2_bin_4]|nr:site-specific DNA-methyltransferase [Cyanobacteria bacterium MAG CAR2_bin_4]
MPTLEFKGKQHVYAHHLTVPYRPLVPDSGKSLHPADVDDNLILHGDNLHALKALLPRYAGKVKCIYIDPPYNTGNEGWIYNDNINSPLMRQWLASHSPVDGEDLERHDKWLCMMWPRLHLLRELLANDGVIFVSIDDNEQHHLRMIMDEIFGEGNFIATITWQKKYGPANDAKHFSETHDFVLCFSKDKEIWRPSLFERNEEQLKAFKNPDNDPRGPWRASDLSARTYSKSNDYPITGPDGKKYSPPKSRSWIFSQNKFKKMLADNRIIFGINGNGRPMQKRFLSEVRDGITVQTWWDRNLAGDNKIARYELKELFPENIFPTPKPTLLLERIVQISTQKDSIILDSFAGSGTTAQAVLALNKEDDGNRKFILVECEDYADTVTAERIRRVINGVPGARDQALREGLGGSFTYCTLGNPIDVEGMLTGESLPEYSQLAAYLLYTASGLSTSGKLDPQNDDGLFYRNGDTDYYLLYRPEIHWLRSNAAVLTEQKARRIHAIGRKAVMFAADKFMSQRFLSDLGITFCQIPYELHRNGSGGV